MKRQATDRVADYRRFDVTRNEWAFTHRATEIRGTVHQQKNPDAAGMEWVAVTSEGHEVICRTRHQAVHCAVARQVRSN